MDTRHQLIAKESEHERIVEELNNQLESLIEENKQKQFELKEC